MNSFESLFTSFGKCTKCRQMIPEIGNLNEDQFKFHWRPYLRGMPPLHFVFLGWEPSWPTWQVNSEAEGGFNEPLQFAIRKFLASNVSEVRFLITNMAQCSMKTGELCSSTREARFSACSDFLKKAVQLAVDETRREPTRIVAIGWQPLLFLKNHPRLLQDILHGDKLHRITHYSPRCNPHFHRFATERNYEFHAFSEAMRSEYENFIKYGESGEFANYWEHYAKPGQSERDLQRIFKWKYEFEDFRFA